MDPKGTVSFTLNQLIKNYCHLGHMSKLLHKNSADYLIGNYFGVSIINLNKTLIFLKYSFNILRSIFFKNGYIVFVINNKNVKLAEFGGAKAARIIYHKGWKGGRISNFKSFLKKKSKSRALPANFPNAILLNLMKENEFFGEGLRRFPIFILFFIDTIHNIFRFDSFVMSNTRSSISLTYFHFVFCNFIFGLRILKKIKFFEIIKRKILDIFNKKWQKY